MTDQVICRAFDSLHAAFGKNHLCLASSRLLIGLNNISKYEICIIIFVLWSLPAFDKNLCCDSICTNMQIKARWDRFTELGLCERQVRDENYNSLWLCAWSPGCNFTADTLFISYCLRFSVVFTGCKSTAKRTYCLSASIWIWMQQLICFSYQ